MTESETISIPAEEYHFLADCKKILELEIDTDLTPETLKELQAAVSDVHAGKGKRFTSKQHMQDYFEAL